MKIARLARKSCKIDAPGRVSSFADQAALAKFRST